MIQTGVVPPVFDAGFTDNSDDDKKLSTMKAKHPPRTATHNPPKNAITHGYVLNTARVRKKKRREVNTIVAEEKMTTNLLSMTHIETDENWNRVTKQTTDTVYAKQHNL